MDGFPMRFSALISLARNCDRGERVTRPIATPLKMTIPQLHP